MKRNFLCSEYSTQTKTQYKNGHIALRGVGRDCRQGCHIPRACVFVATI